MSRQSWSNEVVTILFRKMKPSPF